MARHAVSGPNNALTMPRVTLEQEKASPAPKKVTTLQLGYSIEHFNFATPNLLEYFDVKQ